MENEITVNGETYIRKTHETADSDYVIVRTESAGVHAGYLVSRNGSEAELSNARRIWKWSGAASLSQLAGAGTSDPGGCKFPAAIDKITVLGVIEVIPCTETAKNLIMGVDSWVQ